MQNWLITGGAGFIGTNFVRHLENNQSANLVVLDALTYAGNVENLEELIKTRKITFIQGDICDAGLVDSLFAAHEFDRVVHFAAESHVDRSILEPGAFITTNVNGTYVLLNSAQKAWAGRAQTKRFIHVSTDEVFGDLPPDGMPFDEATAYNPSSPYAASKAASDHLARAWHRTFDLPVIVTNCSNNYGPWQFPEKFIPLMITNALEKKPLPVYGDGKQRRDWLHVEDHCAALFEVANNGEAGRTYAIGGGCEMANIDVLHLICSAVDKKLGRNPGESEALIEHVTDRPGHDRRYAINSNYIAGELGWSPRHQLTSSLSDLVDWYINHKNWIENIRSGSYREYYEEQYGKRIAKPDKQL